MNLLFKAGTIAGNLSIKHSNREFPSDIFLLLEAADAKLLIVATDGSQQLKSPVEYLSVDMSSKVISSIIFPKLDARNFLFQSFKIMPRAQNAHAYVNAAFRIEFDDRRQVKSCRLCFGGINPSFVHAEATEKLLVGTVGLFTDENLSNAIKSLNDELQPDWILPDASPDYRKHLAISLLYRFFLNNAPRDIINPRYVCGTSGLQRPLSNGVQVFKTDEKLWPLTKPIIKYEGYIQCSGEAEYVNDTFSAQAVGEELWCAFVPTAKVHAKVVQIDASKALVSFSNIINIGGLSPFNDFVENK